MSALSVLDGSFECFFRTRYSNLSGRFRHCRLPTRTGAISIDKRIARLQLSDVVHAVSLDDGDTLRNVRPRRINRIFRQQGVCAFVLLSDERKQVREDSVL